MIVRYLLGGALVLAATTGLSRQPAPADLVVLPALSTVPLRIEEEISSETRKRGDTFVVTVTGDVSVQGRLVIRSGTTGVGEVIHVRPYDKNGAPGELAIAARYLDIGGVRVPLRSLPPVGAGIYRSPRAGFAPGVGVTTLRGKASPLVLPAGAQAYAKTALEVRVAPDGALSLPAETVAEGAHGTVVFFRPRNIAGSGRPFVVFEQGRSLGTLPNAAYFAIHAPVGTHQYATRTVDFVTLEVEAGDTYYVMVANFLDGLGNTKQNLAPATRADFDQALEFIGPMSDEDEAKIGP